MRFYHRNLVGFLVYASLLVLVLLPPFVNSSHDDQQMKPAVSNVVDMSNYKHKTEKLIVDDPRILFQIKVHGFLLWVSMGLLVPVGILVIRLKSSSKKQLLALSGRDKLKILFNVHLSIQILSVVFATIGAILSFKNFENAFNNNHQRVGLALYCIIWIQALIGFYRPHRGTGRKIWFLVHWVFGTSLCILGVINIYTGLRAYHKKTSRSIWVWNLLFTIEISSIAFLYLFQDKWEYIQKEGVTLRDEPAITPTDDHEVPYSPSPRSGNNQKEEFIVPC